MAAKRSKANIPGNILPPPKRVSFPEDEARTEWLPMLLDAYFIADQGVYEGIRQRLSLGHRLACARGCCNCCTTHTTIPVYPLELVGLYWFAIEKMDLALRIKLREGLQTYREDGPCPFLVDRVCIVHPMRPLACRHFNVFGAPCGEGEDPYYTRRRDVLTPIESFKDKALGTMLPFHGITGRQERREAMRNGIIHRYVKNLQELDWKKLSERLAGS